MKLCFWSPMHGTGATANMLAVTLAIANESNKSILMTQTHYNLNNLEKPLVGEISGGEEEEFFENMGVDAVIKYFKAGMLSKEIVDSCAVDISENISLLAGTKQNSRQTYEDSVLHKIVAHVLDEAEEYYDWVVIDTNSGYSSSSIDTVSGADVIVVTLRQNTNMLDDLFENENFVGLDDKKIFYLFGSYDPDSKYNLGNIRRLYKPINKQNSGGLPHSTAFMDSLCDRKAFRYITSNMVAEDYGDREFFDSLREISGKILKMVNEGQG